MSKGIKEFGDRADLLALVEREIVRLKKLSKASGGVDAATVKRYDALRTAAKNYRAAIGGLNIADLTARLKEIQEDPKYKKAAATLAVVATALIVNEQSPRSRRSNQQREHRS